MPQQPQQQQGGLSGIFSDPNVMLGLSLMMAGNSKNPENAIFSALSQMQQAQQFKAQQQMQQAQFALDQQRFGLAQNQDKRQQEEIARNLQAGQGISQAIGQEPSMVNNFQGSGLLGGGAIAPNSLPTSFIPPEMLQSAYAQLPQQRKVDPSTLSKFETARALAESGQGTQAASVLDAATPKPFALSPGQQQFSPTGELIAENIDKTKTIENAKTLRNEFINQSKPFVDIQSSYDRIQAVAQKPSAAGDLAMIFNYMKMLDPGSAVREQEFANAQNAAGVPERVRALYNNTLSGQRLTKNTREDFLAQSNNLYQAAVNNQAQLSNYYSELSNKVGVDPTTVIVDYRKKEQQKKEGIDLNEVRNSGYTMQNTQPTASPQVSDAHFAKLDKEMGFPPGKSKEMYMKKMGNNGGS